MSISFVTLVEKSSSISLVLNGIQNPGKGTSLVSSLAIWLYVVRRSGCGSVGCLVGGVLDGMFIRKMVPFNLASAGGIHGRGLWMLGLNLLFLVSTMMNFFSVSPCF